MRRRGPELGTKFKVSGEKAILNKNRLKAIERINRAAARIDLKEVYRLASCMLSFKDIATALKMDVDTFHHCIVKDAEIQEVIDRGYSDTRQALGKKQLDLALNGDRQMLIWLGKQYLNQSDRQDLNTKTEISITIKRAVEELRGIPRDKLIEAQAMLTGIKEEPEA